MFTPGSLMASSGRFSPSQLFAKGEQGVWFDPSDFSTMFQDSAGTTPVTATGQPVGKINDKSGRGNHATQSVSASRPVLQQDGAGRYYLSFDGVDDCLATAAIPYTVDKMTACAGIRRLAATPRGILVEHTNSSTGRFSIEAPSSGSDRYVAASGGSIVVFTAGSALYTAPESSVLTLLGDIANDALALRRNGVLDVSQVTDQGTGNYNNQPLYIGARFLSSLFFNGNLFGLICRGTSTPSDSGTVSRMETYMNSKTGAY